MIEYAILYAYGALCLALLLNFWRLLAGPSLMDRVLAVDTLLINMICMVMIYGIQQGSVFYFEVVLLLAMFGFISTVAYCKFVLRGSIIE